MKRGQVESYSFLIGILITVAIVAIFIMFLAGFFSGNDEKKLSDANGYFSNISSFYQKCAGLSKDNCYCGSFNVEGIGQAGYRLYLSKLLGESHLLLTKSDVTPDSDELISEDDVLNKKSFAEEMVCASRYEGPILKETTYRVYDLSKTLAALQKDKIITVLKSNSRLCVYETSFDLDSIKLKRDFSYCYAELDSDKVVLLDSASDASSLQIATYMYDDIPKTVGRVDAYFTGGYESKAAWFDSVYAHEKKEFLDSKAYLVHVKTSVDNTVGSDVSDKIIIHYLQDSVVGESFAKVLGTRLSFLNGRYYYNSVDMAKEGTVPVKYKFNIKVEYQANSLDNPGDVYLVCANNDLQVCKEKLQLPAVFVEIVDAEDGFSVFQGHEQILAKSITEGILDFVKFPTIFEKAPVSDQPLFR